MKRFLPRSLKKVLAIFTVLVATVGVTAAVRAWYPQRPTFTVQNPAPYVTFNSITDNPREGDERAFFEAKDAANTQSDGFSHTNQVHSGQELLVRVYVHNNAADNLNTVPDGQGGYKGVARNTKVRVYLPTASANALRANAYVSADNAQPKEVSDSIDFTSGSNFSLEYVPGSAIAYNNAHPNASGMKLSDSIVTTGAPLGYQQPDGIVPGCFQYVNVVTIKVRVKAPQYAMQKDVRLEGQTSSDWKNEITANPGDTVEWRVGFQNTGSTELKSVKVVDTVPTNTDVVPSTVKLYNGNYPSGYTYPNTAIQANGRQVNVDIGNYNPGINAFVLFKTKLAEAEDLPCGTTKIVNQAYATPEGQPTLTDTATVVVNNNAPKCQEKQSVVCDLLQVTTQGDRKISAEAQATAQNGAKILSYRYDFGDQTAPLLTDKTTVEHTYAKDGTYIIRLVVNAQVDGENQAVTSDSCVKSVTFKSGQPTPSTPTTPSELPSTGAGDIVGIFLATSVAGMIAYRLVLSRRYN